MRLTCLDIATIESGPLNEYIGRFQNVMPVQTAIASWENQVRVRAAEIEQMPLADRNALEARVLLKDSGSVS